MTRSTKILAESIYFGESPRWHNGRLWFSDFYAHAVKSVSLAGDVRTEVEIDDQTSGLGWMPDGSLLIVSMTKRRVLRRFPNGEVRLHADLNSVAKFHCNDMVVDSVGRAYVGNFGFDLNHEVAARGLAAVLADHTSANLALISPDGAVTIAAADLSFPNGSVITHDGRTLIVAETLVGKLSAFDIGHDGALSNKRVWASIAPRAPDGIALDANGAVWVANAAGAECVLVAEGGEIVDVVITDELCFACMLGGEDGRTLFMMTGPAFPGETLPEKPLGKIRFAKVDVAHAGRP